MKVLFFLLALTLVIGGCVVVPKEAERFIIDSDYAKHQEQKDQLEKDYLNGKISYSEYRSKMDEFEQDRMKSEQEREEILFK